MAGEHISYDPSEVVITYCGLNISQGMGDGDFISVEPMSDRYADKVGIDGNVARSKNNDKRATVKITTMEGGSANALLQQLHNADAVGALSVVDLNGSAIVSATKAWIKKLPTMKRGKEVGANEWTLLAADMNLQHSAAAQL